MSYGTAAADVIEHHVRRVAEASGAGWSAECSAELRQSIIDAFDAIDRRIGHLTNELRQRTRGVEPDLR